MASLGHVTRTGDGLGWKTTLDTGSLQAIYAVIATLGPPGLVVVSPWPYTGRQLTSCVIVDTITWLDHNDGISLDTPFVSFW